MRLPRPTLYGHRGASRARPENTLASFAHALETGADAIETDAHLTRDGVAILAHDDDAVRTTGVKALWTALDRDAVKRLDAGATFTDPDGTPWRARGCTVPTLAEALREFPDTFFNIDLKSRRPAAAAVLIETIRDAKAEDRTLITSFHEDTLHRVRALGFGGAVGLGGQAAFAAVFAPMPVLRRFPLKGSALQIPDRFHGMDLGAPWVSARCRELGIRLDFWVINDPSRAAALLANGADGIVTDDPAAILPVIRSARGDRAPSS